jgi:filamentous hemagglutinin family protein
VKRKCFGRIVPLAAGLAIAAGLPVHAARAQGITVDGRLSPARTLAGPNYAIGPELGRRAGGNLFHSFGAFGLNRGETATFSGPAGVNNVVGRVTGGAPSSVDGTIRSTIQGANLFLINPAGVVFGPNARVDVSGSFHASSADYLRMRDGARFQATNPDASTLSAAPPEAFGFLSATPGRVELNGTTLQRPPGSALGLIGGPVAISGGTLSVPAGTVHFAGAAGPGEVPVDPRGGPAPTVARSGPVRIERSRIAVSDAAGLGSGGSVFVRAGTLDIAGGTIDADNHGPGPGGAVSLRGDGAVTISDGANVRALARAAGRGTDVRIETAAGGSVTVDAATVGIGSEGAGDGGALSIATGALVVDGRNSQGSAGIVAGGAGTGSAGSLALAAQNVSLLGNARIASGTAARGNGGAVTVSARGDLVLDGRGAATGSGARIIGYTGDTADPGAMAINAGDVRILGNAGISSTTFNASIGRAHNVAVAATNSLLIDGRGAGTSEGAGISTNSFGPGVAGSVDVRAPTITLRNGGFIGSNGAATLRDANGQPLARREEGSGGDVAVTATGALTLDGGSRIEVDAFGSRDGGSVAVSAAGIALHGNSYISSITDAAGRGGKVTVRAGEMALTEMGRIRSVTRGRGVGGEIAVEVAGKLFIAETRDTVTPTGITSQTVGTGPDAGTGGKVTVSAGALDVLGDGDVTSLATGTGSAGDIVVTVAGTLTIDSFGISSQTGIASQTFEPDGGNAGKLEVTAGNVVLRNGGAILSSTSGSGNAGNVKVSANNISLENTGRIVSFTDGSGKGGNVEVTATRHLFARDTTGSDTTTGISVQSQGGATGQAGNIKVDAGSLTLLRKGQIEAGTFGRGDAGNVDVIVRGAILIDGAEANRTDGAEANRQLFTGIASQAEEGSTGKAGRVSVQAGSLDILTGANIIGNTLGTGPGGEVKVVVAGDLLIDGNGVPSSRQTTGIVAESAGIGIGDAGSVAVSANNVTLRNEGRISSSTVGRGIAGTVAVHGGTITIQSGAQIASFTSGPGDGGAVVVTTPGALLLDGLGVPSTRVAASATEPQSGAPGSVIVDAGSITIRGGAQIASTTAGPAPGGDGLTVAKGFCEAGGNVCVTGARDIRLEGSGSQITTNSTGARAAGSIAISAPRVSLRDEASISTSAQTANGGAITIGRGDLLYLQNSRISTSVAAQSGNGGDIAVGQRFVVLDRSVIRADAVQGNGGNVRIRADQFVQSASGSIVSAFSERAVSGEVTITGPPLNLNGSLVVLASELRAAAALLSESCAARGARAPSSLVVAGRGGRRHDPETTLPALYIANRPVNGGGSGGGAAPQAASDTPPPLPPLRTSISLSTRCG